MKNVLFGLLFAAVCGVSVEATPIVSVDPASVSLSVGGMLQVDVLIDPDGVFIGAYDLTVQFDPTLLALQTVTFGTSLGGPFDAIQDAIASAGAANVAEVSLLLFDPLFGPVPQDGTPFRLFTLLFLALGAGTSTIDVVVNALGDDLGDALLASSSGSSIRVTPAPVAVAEPPLWALLLAGLASVWLLRCRAIPVLAAHPA